MKNVSQKELASHTVQTPVYQIRAGKTHRFIDLMFVTVEDRVFCRRYTYSEPSWRTVFLGNPEGQVSLGGENVDIIARIPDDLDQINEAVNESYVTALHKLGASNMIDGATDARAMESTMEIIVS